MQRSTVYIEINLLPQNFRPKKRFIRLDYRFVLFMVIVLGAAGVGGYYYLLKKSSANMTSQISFYKKEETKLRSAVVLNKEVNDLKKLIEERVVIIKELTGDSDVRFAMLDHINRVVPGNLWLMSISEIEEGSKISYNIEGMSYSKDDISSFLEGLEKFDKFSSVSLESIRPAPLEIRDAFNYVIKVELKSTRPQEPVEETTARGRRPRRR